MESEGSHFNSIEGFSYHKEFISPDDEDFLIKHADSKPWDRTWTRRIQQYGYSYGTNRRESLGGMPEWLSWLCNRLSDESIFQETPNQVIINESARTGHCATCRLPLQLWQYGCFTQSRFPCRDGLHKWREKEDFPSAWAKESICFIGFSPLQLEAWNCPA